MLFVRVVLCWSVLMRLEYSDAAVCCSVLSGTLHRQLTLETGSGETMLCWSVLMRLEYSDAAVC